MATKSTYRVKFRRRRELKTDYRRRLSLIKSNLPRLVVRKSNNGAVTAQLVEFNMTGDRVISHVTSHDLKKFGWKGGCGNIPAAYLTGLLIGKKTAGVVEEAILDIGMQHPARGGKLFATLKGVVDAGLNIHSSEDAYPQDSRIRGEHIAEYYASLKGKDAKIRCFTKCEIDLEQLPSHFDMIKQKILVGETTSKRQEV